MRIQSYAIFILCIIVLLFCGCSPAYKSTDHNVNQIETTIEKISNEQNLKILTKEYIKNGAIIACENENELGIIKLPSNSCDDGTYYKQFIKKNTGDSIAYLQFSDNNEDYITVFFLDDKIKKKASALSIAFQDNIEPYEISQTILNRQHAIIVSCVNEGKPRIIKEISISDNNNNVIYNTK